MTSSSSSTSFFRFRLNNVDYYQAPRTELDPQLPQRNASNNSNKNSSIQVPVIRVFGATETGQKVCAHIHGALPYIYLEYEESLDKDTVNSYIKALTVAIDNALAVSYRRNAYDTKPVYVGHICLVKGVPFYGYHVGYRHFLKVYMLNPQHMTRLADLLYQGNIMNKVFQPYESHLQFLLQWMCDYNLYGCAYIECERAMFRSPVPDRRELSSSAAHKWHDRSIRPSLILDSDTFPRQSYCAIEIDVRVQDIMNRRDVKPRPIHHDFLERLTISSSNGGTKTNVNPPADEKFVHSMAGLWRDETRRRRRRMGLSDSSPNSPFPPDVLVSMSADPRNTDKGGWIHEEEYRDIINKLIQDERAKSDKKADIDFEDFLNTKPNHDHSTEEEKEHEIQTAFESVEELFLDDLNQSQGTGGNSVFMDSFDANFPEEASLLDDSVDVDAVLQNFDREDDEHDDDDIFDDNGIFDDFDPDAHDMKLNNINTTTTTATGLLSGLDTNNKDHEIRHGEHGDWDLYSNDQPSTSRKHKRTPNGTPPRRPTKTRKPFEVVDVKPSFISTALKQDIPETMHSTSHKRTVAFEEPESKDDDNLGSPQKTLHDGLGLLSQSSQGSIKAQGFAKQSPLAFPVVKNPNDPETLFRLSQGEYSNTPKSPLTQRFKNTPSSSPLKDGSQVDSWNGEPSGSATSTSSGSVDETKIPPQLLSLGAELTQELGSHAASKVFFFPFLPPPTETLDETMAEFGIPASIYQDAFYSNEKDVPERPRQFAGKTFKLESNTTPYLPEFDPTGMSPVTFGEKAPIILDKNKEQLAHERRSRQCTLRNWEIAVIPPSTAEVEAWLEEEERQKGSNSGISIANEDASSLQVPGMQPPSQGLSQIDGPTQKNKFGFKYSQKEKSATVQHETQYMSIMSLEVHVNTRGTFVPDPEHDPITCVFWCVQLDDIANEDDDEHEDVSNKSRQKMGVLALSSEYGIAKKMARQLSIQVDYEEDELDLLNRLVDIVRDFDPDIITGYEVHNGSWGYLIERARLKYEYNLSEELSRVKSHSNGRFGRDDDRWGFTHTSTIKITGRHMINVWRAMRGELNLLQYTLENVVFHLLHKRVPHYSYEELTNWFHSRQPRDLARVMNYWISRVQLNLEILEVNELISRTSEQARLLGVDFFSVISRGSQFKVESLMFRIAKPENFMLVSPSRKQTGQQNALECLPLVMEPQSAFYTSPLLVLDFQSLYPSVMIAYNYCYSTCLGRIVGWRGQNKLGFTDYSRQPQLLELLKDYINVAPNGLMYARTEMRKSLLAKMLSEILETRVMVKSGMKADKSDKALQQLLNNRQLALKLIANVTYGYTSASFSGRMPCAEIADSIVQTGRETLEKAIALIHSVDRWGAEVVYGDTDSLFIYLKGRTRDQAFEIGQEIADAVTNANPRPIKLKFEKVYHPCVLLAKKRYVGFKYESPTQIVPEFDAKGIETVRRDGTPAEQKIEEKALKILFRTSDLSEVKAFFQSQCTKIMQGRVSIQDFLFAKEVKLGNYSDRGPGPPGALVATKRMLADPRTEPQYGERVPYLVIAGAPGARLVDRCVSPDELLRNDHFELDAEYYISKNIIPPLERIFNLVGANVRQWYDEMPKVQRIRSIVPTPFTSAAAATSAKGPWLQQQTKKTTLESYMTTSSCILCRAKLAPPPRPTRPRNPYSFYRPVKPQPKAPTLPLCRRCRSQKVQTLITLRRRLQTAQTKLRDVERVCRSCSGESFADEIKCDSRDCPVFYTRARAKAKLRVSESREEGIIMALEKELEW